MATLASVVVKLGANTSGFISDMKRAEKTTKSTSQKMKAAFGVATAAIAAGAAVAGAAVARMASDSLRDADRFQKLGIALGASTEALSQLEFVAQQTGSSFDTFEKGLVKLQKAVSDADDGLTTYTRAFEDLGVNAAALIDMKPEEQLLVMADAVKKAGASTETAAAAAAIFGTRMTKDMLPALLLGSDGMTKLMNEADMLGVTISQDFADSAALFNDSMNKIANQVTGFGRSLTEAMLPAMQSLYEAFFETSNASNVAAQAGEFLGNILRALASMFVVVKGAVTALLNTLKALYDFFISLAKGMWDAAKKFILPIGEAFRKLADGDIAGARDAIKNFSRGAMDDLKRGAAEATRALKEGLGEAVIDVSDDMGTLAAIWDQSAKTLDEELTPNIQDATYQTRRLYDENLELVQTTTAAEEALAAEAEAAEMAANKLAALRDELFPLEAAARNFNDQLAFLEQQFKLGNIPSLEEYNRMVRASTDAYNESVAGLLGYKDEVEENIAGSTGVVAIIENAFKRLDDTLAGFWQDMLRDGEFSFDALKDLALDTLAQMIHAFTTQQLTASLGGVMTGQGGGEFGFGNIFGGGENGGLMQSLFGLFGQQQGSGSWDWGFGSGGGGFNNSAAGAAVGVFGGSFLGGMIDNGDRLGGFDYSGTGAALGAALGSFVPVIGTMLGGILGGVLGGAFGSIFGRDFEGGLGGMGSASDAQFDTVFGTVFGLYGRGGFGHTNEAGSYMAELVSVVQDFDAAMAQFLNDDQMGRAMEAFRNWEVNVNNSATATEEILNSRFEVVLGLFPDMIGDFVNQVEGLEPRLQAFEQIVQAFNMLQESLTGFLSTDPRAFFEELIGGSNPITSSEALRTIAADMRAAFDAFEGTPDQMLEISGMMQARYQAEMDYLRAVAALIGQISDSIEAQRANIEAALNPEGEQQGASFSEIVANVEQLIASIATASSPEEIAQIASQAQALIDQAFTQAQGFEGATQMQSFELLLGLLDSLESAAVGALEALAGEVITEGEELREQATAFAEEFGFQLQPLVDAAGDQTGAINDQTGVIRDEHGRDRDQIGELIREVQTLNSSIRNLGGSQGRVGVIT